MSTPRFAAWLRVTPPPSTISESSAILKHLKIQTQGQGQGQGRVTTFIRAKAGAPKRDKGKPEINKENTNTATYYTAFTHAPSHPLVSFEVPVHHNHPDARTLDPFNIRGLQDRKPHPSPKTFKCTLETADENDASKYNEQIKKDNPYHGSFKVAREDWLQDVYGETGAPPGVKQGLGVPLSETEAAAEAERAAERDTRGESERPKRERMLKMNSLMDTWYEALGIERPKQAQLGRQAKVQNTAVKRDGKG